MITITNTMTNNENRDFVLIFSGIGLNSNPIMVNCSEFTKLIIKFHLLLAAHIPGWRAWCHMESRLPARWSIFFLLKESTLTADENTRLMEAYLLPKFEMQYKNFVKMILYETLKYNIIRYNTIQYDTIQYKCCIITADESFDSIFHLRHYGEV